jgi:hypothetical protein
MSCVPLLNGCWNSTAKTARKESNKYSRFPARAKTLANRFATKHSPVAMNRENGAR